ncbi:MAG TPA: ABC transporter substrate-binding protein [Methylomirabilota bacterium]|nr:ABC transporter substrate-binding protein [Methylomirabilota bacterium]
MSRRERIGWAIATALALAIPIAVLVAVAASPATEQLRASIDQILRVVSDSDLKKPGRAAERRAAIRKVALEIFDVQEITKRVCGLHWSARTPAEREELVGLFRELLERAYLSRIELYNGERIAFTGETVDGDVATVRTRLTLREGVEVPVEYRMMRRGERWVSYDVVIEGVSLVANYRGQFNRILQGGSYAELVRRLRAMLEGHSEAGGAASRRITQAR